MAIQGIGFCYNFDMITQEQFIELMNFWGILPCHLTKTSLHDTKCAKFRLKNNDVVKVFELNGILSEMHQIKFEYSCLFPVMHSIIHESNGNRLSYSELIIALNSTSCEGYKKTN